MLRAADEPELVEMRVAKCHICRHPISSIFLLDIRAHDPENVNREYIKVKDFFINEREFIVYYKYQKKRQDTAIAEEGGGIGSSHLNNLVFMCDDASRRYLLA